MTILLSGGGDPQAVVPLDRAFADMLDKRLPVLYIPVAMEPHIFSYAECLAWFTDTYATYGITRVEMGADLSALRLSDGYGAVFIGGGNTFRLLDAVQRSGFAGQLRAYLRDGGILYGGSAGAILCGATIEPAFHGDENTVSLTDLTGLDLLGGYDVWCHYEEGQDAGDIRAYARPLYLLSEASGLLVRDGHVSSLGEPYKLHFPQ